MIQVFVVKFNTHRHILPRRYRSSLIICRSRAISSYTAYIKIILEVRKMQVSKVNDIKIYNLSAGKSLPQVDHMIIIEVY
jgi:hypothetical protein